MILFQMKINLKYIIYKTQTKLRYVQRVMNNTFRHNITLKDQMSFSLEMIKVYDFWASGPKMPLTTEVATRTPTNSAATTAPACVNPL